MKIRSILLPFSEGVIPAAAKSYAFWLAGGREARIHGLAVIDIKAFEIPVLGTPDGFMPSVVTPPVAESQSLMEEMASAARERLAAFAGECASSGISCSTDSLTGIPAELIAHEAVAHDIVVMSHAGYTRAAAPGARLDPVVPQVVRGSVRPVLVVATELPPGGGAGNILVAFDGSVHAARALAMVVELGARPGVQCTLLTVATSEDAGRRILAPAELYLCHHEVTPRVHVAVGSRPSEVICELVSRMSPDMLVMGAFGHSPVREMIFGSTTERVLSHCSIPVVLQS